MTTQAKVSVISIYYNREDLVDVTVDSILKQTYTDFTLILYDDGSTDNTYHKLKQWDFDPRVSIISGKNKGFVNAMRSIIQGLKSQFICIQGSGDYSHPSRIEKQLNEFKKDPNVAVVGCNVLNINPRRNFSSQHIPIIVNGRSTELFTRSPFTHGEVMFRKCAYDAVGGYRTFFKFSQDYDLWLRLAERYKFASVGETLYHRTIQDQGVGNDPKKRILQAYLSDFAVYCAKLRLSGQLDPIDEFGHLAIFNRQKSPLLAKKLLKITLGVFANHSPQEDSYFCIRACLNEKRSLLSLLLYYCHKINYSATSRLIEKVLKFKRALARNK